MDELYEHQKEGIEFLRRTPHAGLFDEPGLGKSRQALEVVDGPALVTATSMVLDGGVWTDEIAKWLPEGDVTQAAYSGLIRRERNPSTGGYRSTNELIPELADREFEVVVADECHNLKNAEAFWTEAFRKLHYERLILMTGTPIPNWAHEAFSLLRMIYPEEAKPGKRFGSYWRWVKEWFNVGTLRGKGGRVITEWHIGDLRDDRDWDQFSEENWGDRALMRLRDECLDLPPLTNYPLRVSMKGEQARVYKQLKRDFVAWLDSGEEIVAWNDAAQWVKLSKCATSLPNGKGAKIDAYREVLRDRDLPTLAAAHYQESVEHLAAASEEVGKKAVVLHGGTPKSRRLPAVRAFQAGEIDVLCASIDLIAEGFTFNGCDSVLLVERSPKPYRNTQVIRRIHRIGQERPVSAIEFETRDSVDERLTALLQEKTEQQIKAAPRANLRALVA